MAGPTCALPAESSDHGSIHVSDRHHRRGNLLSRYQRSHEVDAKISRGTDVSLDHAVRLLHEESLRREAAATPYREALDRIRRRRQGAAGTDGAEPKSH